MTLAIIDPIGSAMSLVQQLADVDQSVRVVWSHQYRQHPVRKKLIEMHPRIVHVDLSDMDESVLFDRTAIGDGPVILSGSNGGMALSGHWNTRLLGKAIQNPGLERSRWIDKVCLDKILQRTAPHLALGVFVVEQAANLTKNHLLRQRFSHGIGSARWSMPVAHADQVSCAIEYCAHDYQPGQAFFCNGVCFQDGLTVTDAWWCYDRAFGERQLLCGVAPFLSQDDRYDAMLRAVECASDVLELPLGPFHVEGVLCNDGAVKLLKVAPRLAGFPLPALCEKMGCVSQTRLTAREWLSNFAHKVVLPMPTRYAADFSFPLACSGQLVALEGMEEIEQLPSFNTYVAKCSPGEFLVASQDELSYPIVVWLEHSDPQQLDADVSVCRRRLLQGVYRLA